MQSGLQPSSRCVLQPLCVHPSVALTAELLPKCSLSLLLLCSTPWPEAMYRRKRLVWLTTVSLGLDFIAVKRHRDHSHSYKGQHVIGASLQSIIFMECRSHSGGEGAESSTSGLSGSRKNRVILPP